ncbi:hypothetical protein LINGRAHAP2_LOCUS2852 [Linum grandiflorum]
MLNPTPPSYIPNATDLISLSLPIPLLLLPCDFYLLLLSFCFTLSLNPGFSSSDSPLPFRRSLSAARSPPFAFGARSPPLAFRRSLALRRSLSAARSPPHTQPGEINMASAQMLPPGYRFTPSEQELVGYLFNHISGFSLQNIWFCPVVVCDLYSDEEPWDIWPRSQSQRFGLPMGDVFLITKLKKSKSSPSKLSRFVGTSGATWHQSWCSKPSKVHCGSQKLLMVQKKFSYKNTKSSEHGCWLLNEYTISLDGGKTYSEDAICRLHNNHKTTGKDSESEPEPEPPTTAKRKFDASGCSSQPSSKVQKVQVPAETTQQLQPLQVQSPPIERIEEVQQVQSLPIERIEEVQQVQFPLDQQLQPLQVQSPPIERIEEVQQVQFPLDQQLQPLQVQSPPIERIEEVQQVQFPLDQQLQPLQVQSPIERIEELPLEDLISFSSEFPFIEDNFLNSLSSPDGWRASPIWVSNISYFSRISPPSGNWRPNKKPQGGKLQEDGASEGEEFDACNSIKYAVSDRKV